MTEKEAKQFHSETVDLTLKLVEPLETVSTMVACAATMTAARLAVYVASKDMADQGVPEEVAKQKLNQISEVSKLLFKEIIEKEVEMSKAEQKEAAATAAVKAAVELAQEGAPAAPEEVKT